MTIDEVIKLGKEASEKVSVSIFDIPVWAWIVLILLALISIPLISTDPENIIGIFFMWFIITMLLLFYTNVKEQEITKGKISAWKAEIAKPYIESLDVEQREVVFIKIDPELSHEVYGSSSFGSGYTRSEEVQRTPLTVSFKENGITTLTNWYETRMELTEEAKPHIKYQKLNRDLGNGIKKGFYNIEINLPDSYEFTDIK